MISETLNLWDNGAITLPKEWRERYGTKHFLAKEDANGHLVIMPIIDVEYYENSDEDFGIRFQHGIAPKDLIDHWEKAMETVEKEELKKTTKNKNSSKIA